MLASHNLHLLLVQNDAIDLRIAGLKCPTRFSVLGHQPIEEPFFLGTVVKNTQRTKDHDAGVHKSGIAGKRVPSMNWPHFSNLDTNPGILLNVT